MILSQITLDTRGVSTAVSSILLITVTVVFSAIVGSVVLGAGSMFGTSQPQFSATDTRTIDAGTESGSGQDIREVVLKNTGGMDIPVSAMSVAINKSGISRSFSATKVTDEAKIPPDERVRRGLQERSVIPSGEHVRLRLWQDANGMPTKFRIRAGPFVLAGGSLGGSSNSSVRLVYRPAEGDRQVLYEHRIERDSQ